MVCELVALEQAARDKAAILQAKEAMKFEAALRAEEMAVVRAFVSMSQVCLYIHLHACCPHILSVCLQSKLYCQRGVWQCCAVYTASLNAKKLAKGKHMLLMQGCG